MKIEWVLKKFVELNPYELYAVLQLRNQVFVVEQNCVFQDADDKDQQSYHLLGCYHHTVIAYARLIPAGAFYNEMSIGRVVTAPLVRGTGAGKELMQESITRCYDLFGTGSIKIGAQLYLKKFYEGFGFTQICDGYIEDDIPHVHMLKTT